MEADVWVRKLLALGAHQSSTPGPTSLREGVGNPWVSLFELAAARLC
jgi:hypothetical protein